jgi:hypothetical protein
VRRCAASFDIGTEIFICCITMISWQDDGNAAVASFLTAL